MHSHTKRSYFIMLCNRHSSVSLLSLHHSRCFKHFYFHCVSRDCCATLFMCRSATHSKVFSPPLLHKSIVNVWRGKVLRGSFCATLFYAFSYVHEQHYLLFRKKHFGEHYVSEFWFSAFFSYINSIVNFFRFVCTHDSFSHENLHHLSENKERARRRI